MSVKRLLLVALVMFTFGLPRAASPASPSVTPAEARAIAKEAYIYGNPIVDNYRIMYAYFVDSKNPEYKAPFNELKSVARVFTAADKAIQAANSDTPYSFIGLDLRTEPMVLTVPPVEKNRYISLQFIDLYTHNFAYAGSRTTGNDGGVFLAAGPGWSGEPPPRVSKVMRSETELAMVGYRTQLFNPADLENVKKIQAGYKAEPLSVFVGRQAPTPAPAVAWMKPLSVADQKTSPEFFNILNFALQFCPTVQSEKDLMTRFAKIGVGAGNTIDIVSLSPNMKQALSDGIADAWKELEQLQNSKINTGQVTSGDLFGTRQFLKNNYLYRFAGAVMGIYGNSNEEAMYPIYRVDDTGQPLNASANRYVLHFEPGKLPPAHAFWSVTMYDLPANLMVDNPLDRYLINSPMLPDLKREADGGLNIYVQKDSPGKDKESNWLPAPNGPFWMAMRIYWPKVEALNGTWKQPPLRRAK
jgi:hypothetical protein